MEGGEGVIHTLLSLLWSPNQSTIHGFVILLLQTTHMPGQLHGNPKLISNLEVLEILRARPPTRTSASYHSKKKPRRRGPHRLLPADQVAAQVEDYLRNTSPCTRIDPAQSQELMNRLQRSPKKGSLLGLSEDDKNRKNGDSSSSSSSTTTTAGFGLTQAEAIQCLNMVPTEPVEIHLVVEDLTNRLSERQQDELLNVMKSFDTTQQQPSDEAAHGKPPASGVKQEEDLS